jgi:hypothetical protein
VDLCGDFCENLTMNKMLAAVVAGLLLLTGCARTYVLTLNSGERMTAVGKPRLVNGFYYFKDTSGHDARPVFSGRVREIAPASMASGDANAAFKSVHSK